MTPRRGRANYLSGLAAEDQVARHYQRRGAEVLARRHRNEAGEIDLVVLLDGVLVFVEVKRRKARAALADPITDRQWRRLGMAASHYMMARMNQTGPAKGCRFDAALVGADGSLEIVENARSFDEH